MYLWTLLFIFSWLEEIACKEEGIENISFCRYDHVVVQFYEIFRCICKVLASVEVDDVIEI